MNTTKINTLLTRHDPSRQVPSLHVDSMVQVEANNLCVFARISHVRRTGRTLQHVMVTLVPCDEYTTFQSHDDTYHGRTSFMLKVKDDGSNVISGDGSPWIEVAYI